MNETLTSEFIRTLGYGVLRKAIHDPGLETEKVKEALETYSEAFPTVPYTRSLRYKYTWHRQLRRQHVNDQSTARPVGSLPEGSEDESDGRNILLVSHEMSNTGAPRALLTLACTLKENGYRPLILTFRGGPLTEEAKRHSIPVVADFTGEMEILFKGEEQNALGRLIRRFPTIVVNTLEAIWHFPAAARRLERADWHPRIVGWIHEAESAYGMLRIQKEFRQLAGLLDEVLIVGDYARGHAARYCAAASGFRNFYYGIEETERKPGTGMPQRDGKIHLLLAGTLEPRKGQRQAIEALNLLPPEKRGQFTLHFAGSVTSEKVRKMVEHYKDDDVIYHGPLPHDRLIALLEEMDGLLCPSLDDPMPIVCTEAFQMCKPVIVSDATGTAGFIKDGENGFLCKAGDASSLAKALERMLEARRRLPEIGKEGHRIYTENFSMEAFRKQVSRYFPAIATSTESGGKAL